MSLDKLIFSIDIETSGQFFSKNEIVSIGYFITDFKGNTLEKGRISFKVDEKKFEKRCIDEYWSKPEQRKQLNEFQNEATQVPFYYCAICLRRLGLNKPSDKFICSRYCDSKESIIIKQDITPKLGMELFDKKLSKYEKKYNVKILMDNPAFDGGFINYYLETYTNRPTLQYSKYPKEEYRGIYDLYELIIESSPSKFVYDKDKIKGAIKNIKVKHDHYPENDAEYNYRKVVATLSTF